MTDHETLSTGRWDVGLSVALVLGALGVVLGSVAVLLSSIVGLAFAAYGYATRPPPSEVAVQRVVSETTPLPGEHVELGLSVENVGDRALADLRVIDNVPGDLDVVEGTPARAVTLEPGESTTVTYTVVARRGEFEFTDTVLVSRDVSGAIERRSKMATPETITCRRGPETMTLRKLTIPFTGRVETDDGGEGIEFYSTRQYHPTDPVSRIDWNRYARTNELTTVQYREEQAATVVVMVDAREEAAVARSPREPEARDLDRYAADTIAETLLDLDNRVGVMLLGETYDTRYYLAPGTGRSQTHRLRQLLHQGGEALSGDPELFRIPGHGSAPFLRRLPSGAQVVLVTPLVDDHMVALAERLEAGGNVVTVVSPDVTSTETAGRTLSGIERRQRIGELRRAVIRVVEWDPDEALNVATTRAERRWSK